MKCAHRRTGSWGRQVEYLILSLLCKDYAINASDRLPWKSEKVERLMENNKQTSPQLVVEVGGG